MRLSTRLRPRPETTTHTSAAIGASHRSSFATKWLVVATNPSPSCAAAIHGFCASISDRPEAFKRQAQQEWNASRAQQTSRNGTPKTQRHATSSAVIDGRRNTQPIWSTSVCVPRTGAALGVAIVANYFTTRFTARARHDDDLRNVLPRSARLSPSPPPAPPLQCPSAPHRQAHAPRSPACR